MDFFEQYGHFLFLHRSLIGQIFCKQTTSPVGLLTFFFNNMHSRIIYFFLFARHTTLPDGTISSMLI